MAPVQTTLAPADRVIDLRTNHLGRGVYAARAIARGERIEVSPVVLGDSAVDELPGWLRNYVYDWEAIGGTGARVAVALGIGSLFNASMRANVTFRAGSDNHSIEYHAARDIEAGEALTINYSSEHGGVHADENSWFTERGIEFHEG